MFARFRRLHVCLRHFLALQVVTMGCAIFASEAGIAGSLPEDHLPGLRPILTRALELSPQLIAAEFDRIQAELRITSADASRLPGLSGNFNLANNETAISARNSSQSRDNGFFYNFSLTQPLFHWRALQNQSTSARIGKLLAERNFERASREIAVVLRRAYLSLIVEKARLRAARNALQVLQEDLAITREKKERGLVASAVLEGDRLREREIRLEVSRLEAEFESNRRRFSRLSALSDLLGEEQVPDEIPMPRFSVDLAAALAAAVLRDNARSSLEFEIHELRLREIQLRLNSEKVRLYPKFFAGAGYSLENSTTINQNSVNQQGIQRRTVSVYAQWNIFDGFATRAAIRETQASKRTQERLQQAEIESLLQNIQSLERMLRDDAELVELTTIRHALAVEARKSAAREAEFGNVPKSEVTRAGTVILQAETRSLEARAQMLSRWGEFVALTAGDPLLPKNSSRHASEPK